MFRRMGVRLLGTVCSIVLASMPVMAQPVVTPGPQPVPPIAGGEPQLDQQHDGRRAVRGCATDTTCARPGDTLREFELEAFPKPGSDPWVNERAPAGSRLEPSRASARIIKKPSELRPDAPWLDTLELPDLPVKWSQKLVDYLVFYHDDPRGRAIMQSWLVAQGRYRDMILNYLRKAKLPQDLLYVAMIESGYDPGDKSSAGALGLWQFMREGGRIYGLREDRWVDERRDPYRSTIAQMDYFHDLHQRFNDWPVALAAFNMGYGAMLRSITRYNTNDYYALCEYENGIPWETCLYTPKVLATAIVGHNRAAFKFDTVKEVPAEKWDDIAVPTSLALSIIARAAGTTEDAIKKLNPHLRQGRTPPGETNYVVRVPAGAKPAFAQKLAELQTEWDGMDSYVVAHGERFEDVATTFGISLAALKKLNNVTHESEISGGTVVVVPRISEDARQKNRAKARAKLLGSGVDHKDGELLLVPIPDKDAKVFGKRRVFYRVVTGDSVKSIAKAFSVGRDELAAWNGIEVEANLHPKMVLVAWVPPAFDADKAHVRLLEDRDLLVVTRGSVEHLDLAEQRTGRVRSEYVAAGREKLEDVAKKFGMGSHDLARINRISYDTVLTKGQKVIVYAVVDPKRSARAAQQWKKTPKYMRGKTGGTPATVTTSVAGSPADPYGENEDEDEGEDEGDEGDGDEGDTDSDRPSAPAAKPSPKSDLPVKGAVPSEKRTAKASAEQSPKSDATKGASPSPKSDAAKGASPSPKSDAAKGASPSPKSDPETKRSAPEAKPSAKSDSPAKGASPSERRTTPATPAAKSPKSSSVTPAAKPVASTDDAMPVEDSAAPEAGSAALAARAATPTPRAKSPKASSVTPAAKAVASADAMPVEEPAVPKSANPAGSGAAAPKIQSEPKHVQKSRSRHATSPGNMPR